MVSEKKMFENVNGRMTDTFQYCKLICGPKAQVSQNSVAELGHSDLLPVYESHFFFVNLGLLTICRETCNRLRDFSSSCPCCPACRP